MDWETKIAFCVLVIFSSFATEPQRGLRHAIKIITSSSIISNSNNNNNNSRSYSSVAAERLQTTQQKQPADLEIRLTAWCLLHRDVHAQKRKNTNRHWSLEKKKKKKKEVTALLNAVHGRHEILCVFPYASSNSQRLIQRRRWYSSYRCSIRYWPSE